MVLTKLPPVAPVATTVPSPAEVAERAAQERARARATWTYGHAERRDQAAAVQEPVAVDRRRRAVVAIVVTSVVLATRDPEVGRAQIGENTPTRRRVQRARRWPMRPFIWLCPLALALLVGSCSEVETRTQLTFTLSASPAMPRAARSAERGRALRRARRSAAGVSPRTSSTWPVEIVVLPAAGNDSTYEVTLIAQALGAQRQVLATQTVSGRLHARKAAHRAGQLGHRVAGQAPTSLASTPAPDGCRAACRAEPRRRHPRPQTDARGTARPRPARCGHRRDQLHDEPRHA